MCGWYSVLVLTTQAASRTQHTAQRGRRCLGNERLVRLVNGGKEEGHNRHNLGRRLTLGNLGRTPCKQQGQNQGANRLSVRDLRRHHILDGEAFLLGLGHLFLPMKMD